ncbi:MAG TPA: hypothetical protein VL201_01105 [Patescibacteria group bacterium]|nr:hypothetical protein [Patescibacteria group bacterium]
MQAKADKNFILFYNALKNPAKISPPTVQNELQSIADNNTIAMYLPTENVQPIITQLGFEYIPQLEEQWTITMPIGTVTIDFLLNQVTRIIVSSQLLTTIGDQTSLKALTLQNVPNPVLPSVIFGLPVQDKTALSISNKNIIVIKPAQLAELITNFFFKLLEKGKKQEEAKSLTLIKPEAKQKISPAMRKIVELPVTPPQIRIPKREPKSFSFTVTPPIQKPAAEKANPPASQKKVFFIPPSPTSKRFPVDAGSSRLAKIFRERKIPSTKIIITPAQKNTPP